MSVRRAGLSTAVLVMALIAATSTTPAVAATATVPDPTGDSRRAADLVALDVRHAEPTAPDRVVLRARHTGLPDFDSRVFTTVTFWIDVDRADPGPEFVTDVVPNSGAPGCSPSRGGGAAARRSAPAAACGPAPTSSPTARSP